MWRYAAILALLAFVSCSTDSVESAESKNAQTRVSIKEKAKKKGSEIDTAKSILTGIFYSWEDPFSDEAKLKVRKWLDSVTVSVALTIGEYPFYTRYFVHLYDKMGEPVPWAHTSRGRFPERVHFYIDPDYDISAFLNDWTAQHEISHLSLPFLGKENAWFSEGHATFLQCQVMHTMGIYTKDELTDRYKTRMLEIKKNYQTDQSMIEAIYANKMKYNYSSMYWGGVSYFLKIDRLLKKQNQSIVDLFKKYLTCCRREDDSIEDVITSFDNLSGTTLFSDHYEMYNTQPAHEVMAEF